MPNRTYERIEILISYHCTCRTIYILKIQRTTTMGMLLRLTYIRYVITITPQVVEFVTKVVNPIIIVTFVVMYWVIGIILHHNPTFQQ